MAWVVDTCVLIDVLDEDPHFGKTSAACLQDMLKDGLIVAPVSYIELAPAFMGNQQTQEDFLDKMLAVYDEPWTWEDTEAAHAAWARYVCKSKSEIFQKDPSRILSLVLLPPALVGSLQETIRIFVLFSPI